MRNRIIARLEALEAAAVGHDPYLLNRLASEYKAAPTAFNEDILGRIFWSRQREVAEAVNRYPVVVVPAGRSVGKSFMMAGLALWYLYTRPGSRVIATSSDHRQISTVFFSELKKALSGARVPLPYEYVSKGLGSPQRLTVSSLDRWECLAWSARETESFSGQHAGELLVLVDEASAITDPIWTAIDGLGATRLVVAGNALAHDSRFRELADLGESGDPKFKTIRISSLESPDADREQSLVGLASRPFISYLESVHGRESVWFGANVLGKFPGAESVTFLPTAWLDACESEADTLHDELWEDCSPGATVMGIDPAGGCGGGDRSVICIRNHKRLLEVFCDSDTGILDNAKARLEPVVISLAQKWKIHPSNILYDAGGLGRNFGDYLASHGLPGCVAYYGSGRGGKYYASRRAANAHRFRRRIDPKSSDFVPFCTIGIPEWPAMRQELSLMHEGPMDVGEEGAVRQSIESKESLMARMHGRSPDLSDALLITYTYKGD